MADKINLNLKGSGSKKGNSDINIKNPKPEGGLEIKIAEPVSPAKPEATSAKPAAIVDKPKTDPIKPAAPEAAKVPLDSAKTTEPAKKKSLASIFSFGKKKDSDDASNEKVQSIFNKEKKEETDSKMIKGILKKSAPPKIKPILGSAPSLQKSIEDDKHQSKKGKLRTAQIVFLVVTLAALGMIFFFYSQISPTFDLFGANPTARLTDINKNLRSAQTSINKYRYLAAQLDLNTFSFVSDDFLDKTSKMSLTNLTPAQEADLIARVSQAVQDLPNLVATIKENLTPDIVIDTYRTEAEEELTPELILQQAETDLRNLLLDERKQLTKNTELSDENEQDLRLVDNTLKLIGNNKLLSTIKAASVQDFQAEIAAYAETLESTKREELQKFMGNILASTKSDIATIGAIKSQRTSWLWIIEKIEEVTTQVDPNFNSGLFEVTGLEVVYTGYELDATSNKIILSGITKTSDAKNFSIISRLIDEFEGSQYFENVEMRSFSKSGDAEAGFTANFKIDLNAEVSGVSPKNKPISLVSRPVASKPAGVKRTQ